MKRFNLPCHFEILILVENQRNDIKNPKYAKNCIYNCCTARYLNGPRYYPKYCKLSFLGDGHCLFPTRAEYSSLAPKHQPAR